MQELFCRPPRCVLPPSCVSSVIVTGQNTRTAASNPIADSITGRPLARREKGRVSSHPSRDSLSSYSSEQVQIIFELTEEVFFEGSEGVPKDEANTTARRMRDGFLRAVRGARRRATSNSEGDVASDWRHGQLPNPSKRMECCHRCASFVAARRGVGRG